MPKEHNPTNPGPFFDTSILAYAYLLDEAEKHEEAKVLVKRVFDGETNGAISNQVLAELSYVLIKKYNVEIKEVETIIEGFVMSRNWRKISYTPKTVLHAVNNLSSGARFFDSLILETMKENSLSDIITENEKDFKRMPGIKVINPFK